MIKSLQKNVSDMGCQSWVRLQQVIANSLATNLAIAPGHIDINEAVPTIYVLGRIIRIIKFFFSKLSFLQPQKIEDI